MGIIGRRSVFGHVEVQQRWRGGVTATLTFTFDQHCCFKADIGAEEISLAWKMREVGGRLQVMRAVVKRHVM
jgi:hypothetical protein